jgi:hypothetical protein
VKDIYKDMNTQNILKFYGSKLDLKLDHSEFYDFQLHTLDDYNKEILDLTTPIIYTGLTLTSDCITGNTLNEIKPWVIEIDKEYSGYTCDFTVRSRTELGWTLDFVFNRDNLPFSDGNVFYYIGIDDENDESIFADNNLSFSFTDDGRIRWQSYRYSGYCSTDSGYTESFYISSGITPTLCLNGVSEDFNVTITFQRNHFLENCDLLNDGGINDLVTEVTEESTIYGWMTGSTQDNLLYELNKKWMDERYLRLGTLRIFLNGNQIYKIDDWEEVIPSVRNSENIIIQSWGGGCDGYLNLHTGVTNFNLLQIKYFEEPLQVLNVRHHYLTEIKTNFNIFECGNECLNDIYAFVNDGILSENGNNLITEDNNMIIYN